MRYPEAATGFKKKIQWGVMHRNQQTRFGLGALGQRGSLASNNGSHEKCQAAGEKTNAPSVRGRRAERVELVRRHVVRIQVPKRKPHLTAPSSSLDWAGDGSVSGVITKHRIFFAVRRKYIMWTRWPRTIRGF